VGGVAGPAFIKINSLVTAFRMRNIGPRPLYRALEVLFFLLVWTVLVQYAPLLVECLDVPTSSKENWELNLLLQWTCPPGQYNGLASLLSVSQTNALRALLKQQASTDFSLATLILFSLIYFFGAALIAGSTLVSGLMVPFLLVGAGYGRLVGQVVQTIVGTAWPIEVGLYAVIGATSFFGGVSRMTISLSVIMLEITGNMSLLLPIMITAMVSKWVGTMFRRWWESFLFFHFFGVFCFCFCFASLPPCVLGWFAILIEISP
jgi:H+/Cl- antiporter ClcA